MNDYGSFEFVQKVKYPAKCTAFAIDTVTKTICHESNSARNGGFNQWQWCMFFSINRIDFTTARQSGSNGSHLPLAKCHLHVKHKWKTETVKCETFNRIGKKHVFKSYDYYTACCRHLIAPISHSSLTS